MNHFFEDCQRVLKPNGEMLHLIDLYLEDEPAENQQALERVQGYRRAFESGRFAPTNANEVITDEQVAFSTAYVINPDNVMNAWNRLVPSLKEKRTRAQSCTLIMRGTACR